MGAASERHKQQQQQLQQQQHQQHEQDNIHAHAHLPHLGEEHHEHLDPALVGPSESVASGSGSGGPSGSRPVRNKPGRPRGQIPVPFTEHDEEMLVKYMSTTKTNLGKTGLHYYNLMVLNLRMTEPWVLRHPPSAWQNRYSKNRKRLDQRIAEYKAMHPDETGGPHHPLTHPESGLRDFALSVDPQDSPVKFITRKYSRPTWARNLFDPHDMHEMITYALHSLAKEIHASEEIVIRIFHALDRQFRPTQRACQEIAKIVEKTDMPVDEVCEACMREQFDYEQVERSFEMEPSGLTGTVTGAAGQRLAIQPDLH